MNDFSWVKSKEMDSVISRDYCKDVLPIPQFSGTCWFNALLMALFYSELTRNFFINELPNLKTTLKKHPKILNIIEDLLFNNYRVNNKNNDHFYNIFQPENILLELNKADKTVFYADSDLINTGWHGHLYIDQIFQFLNIKNKILYLDILSDHNYSLSKKNAPLINFNIKNDVITLEYEYVSKLPRTNPFWKFKSVNKSIVSDFKTPKRYSMPDDIDVISLYINNNQDAPPEVLQFKNAKFILDSMMINNFNIDTCKMAHQIAGITCKSKKYLYNGWTGKTKDPAMKNTIHELHTKIEEKEIEINRLKNISNTSLSTKKELEKRDQTLEKLNEELRSLEDKFLVQMKLYEKKRPCNLVRYDWNTDNNNFCIDSIKCEYPKKTSDANLCFNMKRGSRSYIYVRESFKYVNTSTIQPSPVVKPSMVCPEDKILNPKTNKCVSKTGVVGKKLLEHVGESKKTSPVVKPSMVCPEDKILNPKTNKCVSKTGAIGKKLLKN